jgi:hypothetical protein
METNEFGVSREEQEQLDDCLSHLTEEQIVQCDNEAQEIAIAVINEEIAGSLLVPLLVKLKLRQMRAEVEKLNIDVESGL